MLNIIFLIVGIFFIYGTATNRWPIVLNPPDKYWMFYSQSFIKKLFGENVLRIFNYVFGAMLIFLGLMGLAIRGH